MEKQKLLAFGLMAVLVIGLGFIGGCVQQRPAGEGIPSAEEKPTPVQEEKLAAECEKITDLYERDECFYNLATATKDALTCEKISDPRRDGCYYNISIALQDASLCGKIKAPEAKIDCYKKQVAECDKIENPGEKIACYMRVGGALKGYVISDKERGVAYAGYSICGIIDEAIRQKCYEEQRKECEKIGEEDERSGCYYFLAISSKAASFCEKITFARSTALGGRDYCYWAVGAELRDSSICEKIEDTKMRDNCLQQATCIPDWQCSDWTECIRGSQTRKCTDLNNCYTGKPPESQSCKPAQPINFLTYESPAHGIRIQYPQDWTKREGASPNRVVGFLLPEEDAEKMYQESGVGFIVGVEDISTQPMTLDEYAQSVISQIEASNFDIIDSADTTLSNNPAHKLVYEWRMYVDLTTMVIFTIKGNKLYTLAYIAEPYRYPKYLDEANEMVDSFEII